MVQFCYLRLYLCIETVSCFVCCSRLQRWIWIEMAQLFQALMVWLQKFPQNYYASSLSFSTDLVRGVHARTSVERRSLETREKRALPSSEAPISHLRSRAWSFACLARFARWTKNKGRLLVV